MAVQTAERAEAGENGRAGTQAAERVNENPSRFQRYRIRTGMFAWMAHRLSGVALVVYLVLHIWGLRALTDRAAYNELIAKYHAPIFKVGEFLLLAAVAYHAMNGLRIILMDFLGWHPNQKKLFWTLSAVTLLIVVVGGYPSIYALVVWLSEQ